MQNNGDFAVQGHSISRSPIWECRYQ